MIGEDIGNVQSMSGAPGSPRQFPLPFERAPRMTRDTFMVSPANAEAVGWLDRWPDWPMPVLVVYGPSGCGKTHLLSALVERARGVSVPVSDLATLDPVDIVSEVSVVAVDDAQAVEDDRQREDGLFHLYNAAVSRGRTLLLAAKQPPVLWDLATADLGSRLRAAALVGITDPDDSLLAGVLRKRLEDRHLPVGDDVIRYLVARMERSFAAAEGLAERIDALSMAEKRQITVRLAARALEWDPSGG